MCWLQSPFFFPLPPRRPPLWRTSTPAPRPQATTMHARQQQIWAAYQQYVAYECKHSMGEYERERIPTGSRYQHTGRYKWERIPPRAGMKRERILKTTGRHSAGAAGYQHQGQVQAERVAGTNKSRYRAGADTNTGRNKQEAGTRQQQQVRSQSQYQQEQVQAKAGTNTGRYKREQIPTPGRYEQGAGTSTGRYKWERIPPRIGTRRGRTPTHAGPRAKQIPVHGQIPKREQIPSTGKEYKPSMSGSADQQEQGTSTSLSTNTGRVWQQERMPIYGQVRQWDRIPTHADAEMRASILSKGKRYVSRGMSGYRNQEQVQAQAGTNTGRYEQWADTTYVIRAGTSGIGYQHAQAVRARAGTSMS